MASVRRRGGIVRVTLDDEEAALLASLAGEVVALLDPPDATSSDALEELVGISDRPVPLPEDPALRRLLPDAYRDDAAAAAEFRRLTDIELRTGKTAALRRIATDVAQPPVVALDDEGVERWLHGLNDIRLAFGTRLEVGEDIDAERASRSPEDPHYAALAVYDWLTWLQESLVRVGTGNS